MVVQVSGVQRVLIFWGESVTIMAGLYSMIALCFESNTMDITAYFFDK